MALTFCEEHEADVAESVNGDPTSAPLAGLLTVTVASAGNAMATMSEEMSEEMRGRAFMRNPLRVNWF